MQTHYHEFESLEHLLATRLLPGGGDEPVRFVVFGGTGAVGGAVVLELCKLILMSRRYREQPLRGEIYATGVSDKDISKFASRLYLALGDEAKIDKIEPRRHYRIDDRIDLRFSLLHLRLPQDLRERVGSLREAAEARGEPFDLEAALVSYFEQQPKPFLAYVEQLERRLWHAVVVAIPLPSVATYTLGILDRLVAEHGLDHRAAQRIKAGYLRSFVRGLAVIQQRHARCVVIAHTTAVGGMYRVDGGDAEIRLGFAHSALGKKLVDKKYFADQLTRVYLDHGFDVLITAAAIGIDAVENRCRLPMDRGMRQALQERIDSAQPTVKRDDLAAGHVLLFPAHAIPLEPPAGAGGTVERRPLWFGGGKDLIVDAAIRSGENGLFTVANCLALYNVMKVAIPEELAMVLVRHAVFGPERRRDWFQGKICYYSGTENALFALRLLENYPQLLRSHLGAFAIQAYQALGSATHQARLHELGLLVLLLRLRDLGRRFESIPEQELADAVSDLDAFFWRATRPPAFEDLDDLEVAELTQLLGHLCETEEMEDAGRLLGYDPRAQGRREPGREKFLARLATTIRRYLQTITSLGIPIIYRRPVDGSDRLLVGPYVAPLELAVASSGDLHDAWQALAEEHGVPLEAARDWVIANNGFVDLRPHALGSAAQEPGPHLVEQVRGFRDGGEILAWLDGMRAGSYFTTCGLVALKLRLDRLGKTVRARKLELGTSETWKHLFRQDRDGRHVLAPGLVETVRMYQEGLGKVTGTEALWPHWGY
ncbi:MAG: hypothetical protein D6696_18755 [Acidobacteria bacterium]|nr:MAG: hypothetical protein D6696_18755 [Acidobacteriota bacterium]